MAGENRKITRKEFIRKAAVGAAAVGATGLGFAKGVTAQNGPLAPPGAIPANSLLNNRRKDGTWSNPSMPYPTSTYYDSKNDRFTANEPNPFDKNKKGFWDYHYEKGKMILTNPTVVDTRVHDVRFCNGTKGSEEPDGIVDYIPEPVLKTMNGVSYYEYMALLSGVGYMPIGPNHYGHLVYGPMAIGQDGKPYDASGPMDFNTWVSMGAPDNIPRNGLTYEPVYVAYPASGWNGKLIHYMYPFHGSPYFTFAWFFPYETAMDIQYLLKQGYAVCTHLTEHGLLDSEKNVNAHDNHWWDAFAEWLASPLPPKDQNGFPLLKCKATSRYAIIDDGGSEHNVAPDPAGAAFVNSWLGYNYPPGPPSFMASDGSTARNIVHFVKNLLYRKLGRKTERTYLMGHCRTSGVLMAVNCGRINDIAWNSTYTDLGYRINGLTPRSGGNYVTPYDSSSGLVYDGFYARDLGGASDYCADPDFPITAPMICSEGSIDEADVIMYGMHGVNTIRKTIDKYHPGDANYDLNSWIRYYVVEFGTHYGRSSHFATLYNGSGWFYQFGEGAPNQQGLGSRLNFYMGGIADALARLGYPPGTVPTDPQVALGTWGSLDNAWASAMETGFVHRCFDNLIAWAERGEEPPLSRVWSERVISNPYKVWAPDLPLYYWSDACIPNNPYDVIFGDAFESWPELCWVNNKASLGPYSIEPLWEARGSKGIFYPTPYYLERWTSADPARPTYDPATRRAWSVADTSPAGGLDPYWDYIFTQRPREVLCDCCINAYGIDDQNISFLGSPNANVREAVRSLASGLLLDYSTEPLRMPNVAVRLGLYIADTWFWNSLGWWPAFDVFGEDELLRGYTDPYGNRYGGYLNHGDYVNKMKSAVGDLVSQGLYDPEIGHSTVLYEAAHAPFPLPKRQKPQPGAGYWSDLKQKRYATLEERHSAESKGATFFGRGSSKRTRWG